MVAAPLFDMIAGRSLVQTLNQAAMRTLPIVLTFLLAGLSWSAAMTEATAQSRAERGQAVIEKWCRTCHLRLTDRPDPDMAPAYEEIVLRPGRTRCYFEQFLNEDHFPMTTYRLFDDEKADVVAYLMALQRAERAKGRGN